MLNQPRHTTFGLLSLLVLVLSACETTPSNSTQSGSNTPSSQQQVENTQGELSKESVIAAPASQNLWQRIIDGYQLSQQGISVAGKKRMEGILKRYKKNAKGITKQLKASEPYLYFIVEELEKHQLPMEFALLPLVESSYDPFAFSSSRASGLWQFIPGTGKRFGLKENWWLDERRDVVASTRAAIKYLKLLHDHFGGNWLHAIAAYNAGEGTIARAIRRNERKKKPSDYWSLAIPKETRFYIPKLFAWAEIITNADQYGIELPDIKNQPYFATVEVGSQIDFSQLANISGLDIKDIYRLNPEYHRWATDPEPPHSLLFPADIAEQVQLSINRFPQEDRIHWQRYRIQSGDSLSTIAEKFQVSLQVIKHINQLNTSLIRTGDTLLIPQAQKNHQFYARRSDEWLARRDTRNNTRKLTYKVRSGDSLYSIAKRFKVGISNIKRWNNLHKQKYLQIGQRLTLYIR